MEKLVTEFGKSYWDSNGIYQKEYDELYSKLVPSSGEANTVHGEMIRCVSRLLYDYCNNGNCNVLDGGPQTYYETCGQCGGSGYEDEDEEKQCNWCYGDGEIEVEGFDDIIINDYYLDMFNFLQHNMLNPKYVIDLKEFLLDGDGFFNFGPEEMKRYNALTDEVMYQILTTENESINK